MLDSSGSCFQPVGNITGISVRRPYPRSIMPSYSSFRQKQTGFAMMPTPPVRKIARDSISISEQIGTSSRLAMGDATDTSRK